VSGPLERFLIDHGETVLRLPPRLMAGARQSVREPGKSEAIDALAIARAALREGIETLPAARLAGPELEIRLLCLHRQRLVDSRTRLINQLRWELHDLWPSWTASRARMRSSATQQQTSWTGCNHGDVGRFSRPQAGKPSQRPLAAGLDDRAPDVLAVGGLLAAGARMADP
jgi:hypothetical protein